MVTTDEYNTRIPITTSDEIDVTVPMSTTPGNRLFLVVLNRLF